MNFAEAYDPVRALKASWTLLARAPLPLLIGGILLILTNGGGGGLAQGRMHGHGGDFDWRWIMPFLGLLCCVGLVCFLVNSWITIGFALAVERTAVTGACDVETVFDSRGRFLDMVLAHILMSLICIALMIPFAVIALAAVFAHERMEVHLFFAIAPAILAGLAYFVVYLYFVLGLTLFRPAVALEGLGATASITRSWELSHGNRLRLLLYWIVIAVFTALGICLCCVGVFLTATMGRIAEFESYLALVKPDVYARSWLATGNAPAEPSTLAPPPPPAPAS
jgi:hypothetical protein